jgi:hypothetical protein
MQLGGTHMEQTTEQVTSVHPSRLILTDDSWPSLLGEAPVGAPGVADERCGARPGVLAPAPRHHHLTARAARDSWIRPIDAAPAAMPHGGGATALISDCGPSPR